MRRFLTLSLSLSLLAFSFVACGGDDAAQDPGTTGGETATESLEPETPRDESGSTSSGGSTPGPTDEPPTCELVDCAAGLTCVLVQVQCIRAPCPPMPTCVEPSSTCAVTLCGPGTRCEQSAGGARCVPTR